MPGAGTAEIYFIAIMMLLILVVCGVTVFFFAKTYKKEMADRKKRAERKPADPVQQPIEAKTDLNVSESEEEKG